MEESWYDGQVYVGFKDAIYEPSSCLAELHDLLYTYRIKIHVVSCTDGGPDHRITYIINSIGFNCIVVNFLSGLPVCSTHCSTSLLEEPCGMNDVDSKSWVAVLV